MFDTSNIYICQESLQQNLDFIRNHIGPDRVLSSVVKGNAYGHGIPTYVPLAERCGVTHFSVFSANEAQAVCQHKSPETEVMIMGHVNDHSLEWIVENDVSFWVFSKRRLEAALAMAQQLSKVARIHVEVETGMHRTGFSRKELKEVIALIKEHPEHLVLEGVCTHFAGAESITNFYRIKSQIKKFKAALGTVERAGLEPRYRHACCSAACLRFPGLMLDLVRIGILQYGFWPSQEMFIEHVRNKAAKSDPLRRLISWKTEVMSLSKVPVGEYVGYGTTYLAQRDTIIGVAPVGYAHGYSRSLSNQGRALVNGIRVPIIGTVNMNSITLDLTDVPDPMIGDEVTLIGNDHDLEISVASFGEASNQLNYELLTRLPRDIPRNVS